MSEDLASTSVTLSQTESEFIKNAAAMTERSFNEMVLSYIHVRQTEKFTQDWLSAYRVARAAALTSR